MFKSREPSKMDQICTGINTQLLILNCSANESQGMSNYYEYFKKHFTL